MDTRTRKFLSAGMARLVVLFGLAEREGRADRDGHGGEPGEEQTDARARGGIEAGWEVADRVGHVEQLVGGDDRQDRADRERDGRGEASAAQHREDHREHDRQREGDDAVAVDPGRGRVDDVTRDADPREEGPDRDDRRAPVDADHHGHAPP
jgi:hypothetical protein